MENYNNYKSPKNKYIALLLCIIGGTFGLHHFYVGRPGMGILYIFTQGLLFIGWIIDIFKISTNQFVDGEGYKLMGRERPPREYYDEEEYIDDDEEDEAENDASSI